MSANALTEIEGEKDIARAKRETLEFIRAYYRIADPAVRKRMLELTNRESSEPSLALLTYLARRIPMRAC